MSQSRLLVVDADEAVRFALKRLLDTAGFQAQAAPDCHTGAHLLAAGAIDLVVLDLDTFAADGQKFLDQLCAPQILCPVLLLSRAADASDRQEATKVGGLLIKPVEARVLLETINSLLQRFQAESVVPKLETRALAFRRLQARSVRFLRCNLPYRPLYH